MTLYHIADQLGVLMDELADSPDDARDEEIRDNVRELAWKLANIAKIFVVEIGQPVS